MAGKMTQVSIGAVLAQTQKAVQVIYTHFEDPYEFAVVWLPKSQIEPARHQDGSLCLSTCWSIPMWLKRKIANNEKRYLGKRFHMRDHDGLPKAAFGFWRKGTDQEFYWQGIRVHLTQTKNGFSGELACNVCGQPMHDQVNDSYKRNPGPVTCNDCYAEALMA